MLPHLRTVSTVQLERTVVLFLILVLSVFPKATRRIAAVIIVVLLQIKNSLYIQGHLVLRFRENPGFVNLIFTNSIQENELNVPILFKKL